MKIYIIEPSGTGKESEKVKCFHKALVECLMEFGVELALVTPKSIVSLSSQLTRDTLVVVYNEHNLKHKSFEYEFLEKAMGLKAEIWPVAIDRSVRIPEGIISKKQSYDVWEQLRNRDLSENYIPTIAKIYTRKIISRVYPTYYSEAGEIFLSHRRIDGEEITARICDRMLVQATDAKPFRDVVHVSVGEEAQAVIDHAMENSDVFIFIHTKESANSDWIQKELRFAILRSIPIVWVQIDKPDAGALKVMPSEHPHLSYKKNDFSNEKKLAEIVDQILQKAFDLIMERRDKMLGYIEPICGLFGKCIRNIDKTNMIYHISIERKGYHYPQRNIEQYIQLFGRTPLKKDAEEFTNYLKEIDKDSATILTNRMVSYTSVDEVILDNIDDFFYQWKKYLCGKREVHGMEIVISAAFPEGEEAYKQSLTDALIVFEKAIIKSGYIFIFGAHPSLQKLFFEVAKEIEPREYQSFIHMYLSKHFLERQEDDDNKEKQYRQNCQLHVIDKNKDEKTSLTDMRKAMIQRGNVKALVCLGGKIKPDSLDEGIREEIELAKEYGIPVFIIGSTGGCASVVATEYQQRGWNSINNAPKELNERFLNNPDYFMLAQELIAYIEQNNK